MKYFPKLGVQMRWKLIPGFRERESKSEIMLIMREATLEIDMDRTPIRKIVFQGFPLMNLSDSLG